jgi:Mn2+/Fe2+ NRAMP family transporter
MKALFWSAVINGVAAAPIMVMMMLLTMRRDIMGRFTLPRPLQAIGWLATIVMGAATVALIVATFV